MEFQATQKENKWTTLFTEKINGKALLISLGLVTAFQMSGIGAVMQYAANIFHVHIMYFILLSL